MLHVPGWCLGAWLFPRPAPPVGLWVPHLALVHVAWRGLAGAGATTLYCVFRLLLLPSEGVEAHLLSRVSQKDSSGLSPVRILCPHGPEEGQGAVRVEGRRCSSLLPHFRFLWARPWGGWALLRIPTLQWPDQVPRDAPLFASSSSGKTQNARKLGGWEPEKGSYGGLCPPRLLAACAGLCYTYCCAEIPACPH